VSMPYSRINIGDVFCQGYPYQLEWHVTDKADGMVEITCLIGGKNKSLWKRPSDRLFSPTNCVLKGPENAR
jgi:hypothetical protein